MLTLVTGYSFQIVETLENQKSGATLGIHAVGDRLHIGLPLKNKDLHRLTELAKT
jgi:hypothetical protein